MTICDGCGKLIKRGHGKTVDILGEVLRFHNMRCYGKMLENEEKELFGVV